MTEYTSNIKRFCSVYKSSKRKEMYLYVDRKYDLKKMPEALTLVFGEPLRVLDMILTPEKKLARVSAEKVLKAIADKGFFLQMPPVENNDLAGDHLAPKDSLNG
tara:strand:- start:9804 stop:10115 length:312 start_codon:yes stop_codon:yes gene_type:complete